MSNGRESIDRLSELVLETRRRIRENLTGDGAACATYLQLATLRFIGEEGDPSMKEVAAHLRVAPPSATGAIDGLVRAGLLARAADRNDRRSVRLRLTAKGRATLKKGTAQVRSRMRAVLSILTPKERRQLAAMLERLSSAFEERAKG
ncbi:MAG TPA: MarR family transcriptional regulator [Candidatus Binatia bacterium]|jgi:DNA-binding MarR family transcriptional regulator|nr:MarR family transcriptional regulator [Candidatus Binatia bacterium]